MNNEEIIEKVVQNVQKRYDLEQSKLHNLSLHAKTEGEIRECAGNLVESVLQEVFSTLNACIPNAKIVSKVGSTDFLSKNIKYKGRTLSFNTIQVDRHVWANGQRICFIENKTYLDSCYYDRALADFRKIAQSLSQHGKDPADYKYIVFAGQSALNEDTMFTYEADFWEDTRHLTPNPDGLETKTFFFLKGKRSSAKPLYKVKHELDKRTIRLLVTYLLTMLKKDSTVLH